jgi:serine phosphatase RsbU (regulator of sigma subunit)/CHASE3 domain sensor protein
MTLRARLVLSFALVTLLALAGGVATLVMTQRRDDATALARTANDNEERVARLRASYLDQETGYRGFVLTGEATFLEPFARGQTEVTRLERALRADTDTDTDLRRQLVATERAADHWTSVIKPEIALARDGALAAARRQVVLGTSKVAFDALRSRIDRTAASARLAVLAARDESGTARSRLALAGFVTFALALASFVALAFLVRAWVTVPIAALSGAVRSVRGGRLDEPVQLAEPPELAALADDIDAMRLRLVRLATDSERAREAMEQNAAVVLTLGAQSRPEPVRLPADWSLAGEIRPAEGLIAGDTYDFVPLTDGAVGLVVVDISGHGAVAGIVALRGKELLRAALALGVPPGDAIGTAANQLRDLGDEVFLSAFVAVLDPVRGSLTYANAGHPPAFHYRAERVDELGPTGPILGPFPAAWSSVAVSIGPGEALAIFTDGMFEPRDEDRVPFGEGRLRDLARPRPGDRAETIVLRCLDAVEDASAGRRLPDDATLVVLSRHGPTPPVPVA